MPLHVVLVVLRSKWYLIALLTIAGAMAGLTLGLLSPARYVATADVAADPRSQTSNGLASMSPDEYDAFSEDLVYLAMSGQVRDAAAAAGTPAEMVELEVGRVENTRVLRFEVVAPTARRAVAAANSFAEAFLIVQRGRYVQRGEQSAVQLEGEVAALRERVAALDVSLERAAPESVVEDALSTERASVAERLLSLLETQNDRRGAAALAAQGFDLAEPAQEADRSGRTSLQLAVGGGLLGFLVGTTLGAFAVDRRNPVWDMSRLGDVVAPGASVAMFDMTGRGGRVSQSLLNHVVATSQAAGITRPTVLLVCLSDSRGGARAVSSVLQALRHAGVQPDGTGEVPLRDERAAAGSKVQFAPGRPSKPSKTLAPSTLATLPPLPALTALDVVEPAPLQVSAEAVAEAAHAQQTVLVVTQRDDLDEVRRAVASLHVAGAKRLALLLVRA